MIGVVAVNWALFLGLTLMMVGNGLQGTLLGVRATLEAFPATSTGLIMSGYFAGFVAGSMLAPRNLARVGHVRVFAALAAIASAAALLHLLFVEPVTWALVRFLSGLCYAGLYIVAESWLNARATNETRGQLLGFYVAIMLGGMATGQFLLNVADPGSFELFVVVSVLISVAVVPTLLSVGPAPTFETPRRVRLRELYTVSPLGVVGTVGTGISNATIVGMGAVYAGRIGYSPAEISFFMGAVFIGGVLLQWPIGRVSDRFDRRRVITGVTFAAAIAAALAMALGAVSPIAVIVVVGLLGGLSFAMYPLCIGHTNDYLETDQMVAASSTLVLVQGIGATAGPFGAGVVMGLVGASGYFGYLALIHAAIGGFAVWRMSQRPAVPLDEQGPFTAMTSSASPVATAIAPQAERNAMDSSLDQESHS